MQDNAFSKATGPASGAGFGQSYYTRDLMTDPPTIIQIVPAPSQSLTMQRTPAKVGSDTFKISFDDIEPTAGWLSDRNNASLDICFMHSFGKCYGKIREKDSRTCHQIHVKREVLDNLRKFYVNPQRHYFCRTMKANVTEKFAQVLSLLARRRIALQYLEFRTDDIEVTAGSMEYEVEYRHWLVSDADTQQRKTTAKAANVMTDNFFSSSSLCWDFALTGRCSKGASCPDLHGHVAKALTKDRFVKAALAEMGKKESWAVTGEPPQPGNASTYHTPTPSASQHLPPPPPPMPLQHQHQHQHQHQQQPCPPFMMPSPLPPYSFAPPQRAAECAAPGTQPAMAAFPLDMSSLQGAPCFFVSEGNDNVFRLITQPQFTPFNAEAAPQVRN